MKYRFNLIREREALRRRQEALRFKVAWLIAISYSILGAVLVWGAFEVAGMRAAVAEERERLAHVKAEYQRYKAGEMIVTREDVELLDTLQTDRVFWTKKLLVMARYLPENYWITRFSYDKDALTVHGYGYISERQEQLLTLHDYLKSLRNDPLFSDVFHTAVLNSTKRDDDPDRRRARVSFSYSATGKEASR